MGELVGMNEFRARKREKLEVCKHCEVGTEERPNPHCSFCSPWGDKKCLCVGDEHVCDGTAMAVGRAVNTTGEVRIPLVRGVAGLVPCGVCKPGRICAYHQAADDAGLGYVTVSTNFMLFPPSAG